MTTARGLKLISSSLLYNVASSVLFPFVPFQKLSDFLCLVQSSSIILQMHLQSDLQVDLFSLSLRRSKFHSVPNQLNINIVTTHIWFKKSHVNSLLLSNATFPTTIFLANPVSKAMRR